MLRRSWRLKESADKSAGFGVGRLAQGTWTVYDGRSSPKPEAPTVDRAIVRPAWGGAGAHTEEGARGLRRQWPRNSR